MYFKGGNFDKDYKQLSLLLNSREYDDYKFDAIFDFCEVYESFVSIEFENHLRKKFLK